MKKRHIKKKLLNETEPKKATLKEEPNSKWIVSILILSILLRLIRINRNLYSDEIGGLFLSTYPIKDVWKFAFTLDPHPPIYLPFLHFVGLVSQNPIFLRLSSITVSIATIYVVYLIGKNLFDNRTGLLSAFLLAISPLAIQVSPQLRPYPLMSLFLCLTFYFLLKKKWVAYVIFGALSGWTMYLSLFPLLAIGLYGLFREKFSKRVLISNLMMGILLIPTLFFILKVKVNMYPVISHTSPLWTLLILPYMVTALLIGYESPYFYARQPIISLILTGLILSLLFFVFLFYKFLKQKTKSLELSFLIFFPLLINLIGEPFFHLPIDPRRVTFSLAILNIALARGLITLKKRGFLVGVLFLLIISSISLYNFYTHDYTDWKGATKYVQQNEKLGDVIIGVDDGLAIPINFYYKGELVVKDFPEGIDWLDENWVKKVKEEEKKIQNLDNMTKGYKRIWLFIWRRAPETLSPPLSFKDYFRVRKYNSLSILELNVLNYFNERYNLIDVYSSSQKLFPSEGILEVYLFEQKTSNNIT